MIAAAMSSLSAAHDRVDSHWALRQSDCPQGQFLQSRHCNAGICDFAPQSYPLLLDAHHPSMHAATKMAQIITSLVGASE